MTDDHDAAGEAPLRTQLGFRHVVSQDAGASACAILAAVMLVTAGIMWPKAGAMTAVACVGVVGLLAVFVAWRVAVVRAGVSRAVRVRARLIRNRIEPIKHGRSLRRLRFAYDFEGCAREAEAVTATHGPHEGQMAGDAVWILVDPKHPSRTWLLEQFRT